MIPANIRHFYLPKTSSILCFLGILNCGVQNTCLDLSQESEKSLGVPPVRLYDCLLLSKTDELISTG